MPRYLDYIELAKNLRDGKTTIDNPRLFRLLQEISANPDRWVKINEILQDSSWAAEVLLLSLEDSEIELLAEYLVSANLLQVVFPSSSAYRALIVSALRDDLESRGKLLTRALHGLEERAKVVCRLDRRGVVASGYRRGIPLTSYITPDDVSHRIYKEPEDKIVVIGGPRELSMTKQRELYRAVVAVEQILPELRNIWGQWLLLEDTKVRIDNLHNFHSPEGVPS